MFTCARMPPLKHAMSSTLLDVEETQRNKTGQGLSFADLTKWGATGIQKVSVGYNNAHYNWCKKGGILATLGRFLTARGSEKLPMGQTMGVQR